MSKILSILFLFFLLSTGATAQRNRLNTRERYTGVSPYERLQLQRDFIRLTAAQRLAERDGRVSIRERRNIRKLKQRARRDAIRFRYNVPGRFI